MVAYNRINLTSRCIIIAHTLICRRNAAVERRGRHRPRRLESHGSRYGDWSAHSRSSRALDLCARRNASAAPNANDRLQHIAKFVSLYICNLLAFRNRMEHVGNSSIVGSFIHIDIVLSQSVQRRGSLANEHSA